MEFGTLSVIATGITRMLLSYVGSWDSLLLVNRLLLCITAYIVVHHQQFTYACSYTDINTAWVNPNANIYKLTFTGAFPYLDSYIGDHSLQSGIQFSCLGDETSLADCQTSTTSCNSAKLAGVYCAGNVITGIYTGVDSGEVQEVL